MKKYLIVLIMALLFALSGCNKEIKIYTDEEVSAFNEVLTNIGNGSTKAYDLRTYEDCIAGRIPGFYCARGLDPNGQVKTLDQVYEHLVLLLGSKKSTMIILIDNDGTDARYLADKLFVSGYKNIHIFASGYDRYVQLQENFTPETGECDC